MTDLKHSEEDKARACFDLGAGAFACELVAVAFDGICTVTSTRSRGGWRCRLLGVSISVFFVVYQILLSKF